MLARDAGELEPHTDPSSWEWQDPGDWAERIGDAIRSDEERLKPAGKSRLGMLVPELQLRH